MKYLNTRYTSLFDSLVGGPSSNTSYNAVFCNLSSTFCKKTLPSLSDIYVAFFYSTTHPNNTLYKIFRINFSTFSICISEGNMSVGISMIKNGTETSLWSANVPLISNNVPGGNSYHGRHIFCHIDTSLGIIELYCNGILYASISLTMNSETTSDFSIGVLSASASSFSRVYFNNLIVSDSAFDPSERVTNVTPNITSTDWTVSSGVASTDTVGGTMTLTPPANAIDETTKTVTGYSVAFLECTPSATINALDVTQGTTTKQAILPSGGSIELDAFTVSQLNNISASVEAAYVS